MRLDHVQGVPAAGVVGVPARVRLHPVVAPVVDALQGQRRPQLAGLRRVVVDDVEDHLDPGRVQGPHHPFELADLLSLRPGGGVRGVRGEVTDRVVAPVVLQPPAQQMVLVRELVHRQQLDGRDAQPHQVVHGRRVGQSGVGAAQFLRDARVQPREAADVQFVDHRVRPGRLRAAVVGPVVVVVDDDALRDVGRGVPFVPHGVGDLLLGPVPDVPVDLRRQAELAVHGPGVRVQEQLRRVPAAAGPRVPAAVHPVAVALARHDPGHEAVPDLVGEFGEPGACLAPALVEQAQFDRLGPTRPQGEVGARDPFGADPEPGAQGCGRARPHGWARHLARRTVHHGVRRGTLGHRLLLGCAGHRSASRGSWDDVGKERAVSRPRLPVASSSPISAQSGPRTHVSPEHARSLGTV